MLLHYFTDLRVVGFFFVTEGQIKIQVRVGKGVYVYYGLVHISLPHLT